MGSIETKSSDRIVSSTNAPSSEKESSSRFEIHWKTFAEDGITLISEKIELNYTHPSTSTRYKFTVGSKFNKNIPAALENHLLQLPARNTRDRAEKLKIVEPLFTKEIESGVLKLWPTVTGLKFHTVENRDVQWTSFEDTEEIIEFMSADKIPSHITKIHLSELSNRRHLSGGIHTVTYKGDTYVLKKHHGAIVNYSFPLEVEAQIKPGDVPHVAKMAGVVVAENDGNSCVYGMLLEYYPQGDLRSLLRRNLKLGTPVERSRKERWAAQIVHGIMAIHDVGVLHGDLKCGNVVIDGRANVCIIDISDGGGMTDGWNAGGDEPDDPRRDVYGFGVTLWEILNDGDEPHTLSVWLSKEGADDDSLKRVVRRCVVKEVSERPSMVDIFDELGGCEMCGCSSIP